MQNLEEKMGKTSQQL